MNKETFICQIAQLKRKALMQVHLERVSNLTSQIQDLEGKNASLQLTIERLNSSLAKTEEGEGHLKDRVCRLQLNILFC